jgi:hypothetical protein
MDILSDEVTSIDAAEMDETKGSNIVTLRVQDQTTLCSGEDTDEAHVRITEDIHRVVPVKTKWHGSNWSWENTYDSASYKKFKAKEMPR